jgi:myosin-1
LYLNHSKAYQVEGVDDRQEFQDTIKAMEVMGITQTEQYEVLRLLAAILYLGNVTFQRGAKGDDSQIGDPQGCLFMQPSTFLNHSC